MSSWQQGLVKAWYQGAWWLWLLRPLELLFRTVTWVRRWLYRSGLMSSYRATVPVVIVGNITVGGTGKTPIVIALTQALQQAGLRVGVVSRGYGASAADADSDGSTVLVNSDTSPEHCGDEPLLIHRRTGCPVAVNPNRSAAARALLAQYSLDLIISDDGLQHYRLARDFEIAVMDADRQLGNGWCLPAGPLREPRQRLHEVDYFLYRGDNSGSQGVQYRLGDWVHLGSGKKTPRSELDTSQQYTAIAGIGQPAQFFSALQQLGIEFSPYEFPDHYRYQAADFVGLGDRPILMTEKDAVKCQSLVGDQAWYIELEAIVPTALVDKIAALVDSH